ncbi:MAG: hypothetical protein WBP10_02105 [Thermoanaerobaculia bacterium]
MTDSLRGPVRSFAMALGVLLIIALLLAPAPAQAKKKEVIESYTANVMVMDTPGQQNSSILTMNIYGWTSDEDRETVLDAIKEASGDIRSQSVRQVSTTLRKLGKAGYLFLMGERGWPIRYARAFETSSGRQIILGLERPVTFSEVYAGSQARDFDVTVIVLNLDSSGNGEGVASVGTELVWNEAEDKIGITNFSSQPVKLTNVRPSKK